MEQVADSPHPVRTDADNTELDIARAMQAKSISSPQKFHNVYLFDIRISGTGLSFRSKHNEYVMRPSEEYLTDEFLARCNGLPVIMEHPDGDLLDSKEFSDRIVGTIFAPYIKGDEVWGIAKLYDDVAVQMLQANPLSTSPGVTFTDPAANKTIPLEGGTVLLIEGKPSTIDHIAIVPVGVWDKGSAPTGVKSVNVDETATTKADSEPCPIHLKGASIMADEAAAPAAPTPDDSMAQVLALLKSLQSSVSSMDSRMSALELADPEPAADAAVIPAPVAAAPVAAPAAAPAIQKDADNSQPSPEIAEMQKKIDSLMNQIPKQVSDSEQSQLAEAQAKADEVAQKFGDSAGRPLQGETLQAYRKRMIGKFQAHSASMKDVALSSINDDALLAVVEKTVYADAMAAAMSPARVPEGHLSERVRTDSTGRQIKEYFGKPSAWMSEFMSPSNTAKFHKQGA